MLPLVNIATFGKDTKLFLNIENFIDHMQTLISNTLLVSTELKTTKEWNNHNTKVHTEKKDGALQINLHFCYFKTHYTLSFIF